MRIAVSGAHFTGKTTLIHALMQHLPGYRFVEEPYRSLEQEGFEFSHPPSLEDYELQLEVSIQSLLKSGSNTLFDRCPLDFLAYAQASSNEVDAEMWVEKLRKPLQKLDLILFVPVESRIQVPASENLKLRKKVDEKLQELLLEDFWGILEEIEVVDVMGSVEKRVQIAMAKARG